MKKNEPIHHSIKSVLGYNSAHSDEFVLKDWKERTRRVCKPCWELKYCPYGMFVEQSPILPILKSDKEKHIEYLRDCVATGLVGRIENLDAREIEKYREWLGDENLIFQQAAFSAFQRRRIDFASSLDSEQEMIDALLMSDLPSIEAYKSNFFPITERPTSRESYDDDHWSEIQKNILDIKEKYKRAINEGVIDNRVPIGAARLAWFNCILREFNTNDHPKEVPNLFRDAECQEFGHVCPVFFVAEAVTETTELRRVGRYSIPFHTKMRIARRDNYTCQICKTHLRDDEVEFDHIIPISKGGSSEEHNLRLTCFQCNRDKGDKFEI